jgi:hypothetical protein
LRSVTLCVLASVGISLFAAGQAWGTSCYNAGQVCLWKRVNGVRTVPDGSCIKIPTGLFIVDSDSPTSDDGWSGGTGKCGLTTQAKSCGDYSLSNAVCGPAAGTGGDPFGDGDPCDPASSAFDPFACADQGPREDGADLPTKSLGPPPEIVTQHLRAIAKQPLAPHVEKAVEALATVTSLHVRARITVTSEDTGNRPVAGDFEYWEQGGKYRIHVGIDVSEAPVSELAYDGRQFQLVLPKDSLLSIARADERMVPLGIPNPVFLVLQPLSVATPECRFCVLRLSDLRSLRSLRYATGATEQAASRTNDSSFKVTLAATGDPAAIELTQDSGEVESVERADFSDYRQVEGSGIAMPRVVSFHRTVITGDVVTHVAITYRIDELQLGNDIDSSVFTLDRSVYKRVFDGDRKVFLKNVPSDCGKQNRESPPESN